MGVSLNYRQPIGFSDTVSWYGKVGIYNLTLESDATVTYNTSIGVLTDVRSNSITEKEMAIGFGVSYSFDGFGEARFGYERYGNELASIALTWRKGLDY